MRWAFLAATLIAGLGAFWPRVGLPIAFVLGAILAWAVGAELGRGRWLWTLGLPMVAICAGMWVPVILIGRITERRPYGFAEAPSTDWAIGAFFIGVPVGMVGIVLLVSAMISRRTGY